MEKSDPTAIDIDFNPEYQRMVGTTYHGNMEFDVPYMTEIAPNLWQGGCSTGLILPDHIDYLVSLYPWEKYDVLHPLSDVLIVQMYDSLDQATDQIDEIATKVNEWRSNGEVLVHCQAGLNRSSLVVVTALMLEGLSADEAITLVRTKRCPACLCNPAFEEYLREKDA